MGVYQPGIWYSVSVFQRMGIPHWQLITSDFFFMPATVLGGIAYAWVFGVKKIRENQIDPDSDIKLGSWFDTWVKFIAVPIMVLLAAYTFIQAF